MPDQFGANIQSLDALKDMRVALILFLERAQMAMGELRQKVDRTVDWLESDRPNYWRDQEHKAYDLVAGTRIAYETCRLRTTGGRKSDCIEEKKAFERAKARMEYVRQKQEIVRKWVVQAGREANEYRARTSNFLRMLENDVPNLISQIGRMIDAVEAYLESQPDPNQIGSQQVRRVATDANNLVAEPAADPDAGNASSPYLEKPQADVE